MGQHGAELRADRIHPSPRPSWGEGEVRGGGSSRRVDAALHPIALAGRWGEGEISRAHPRSDPETPCVVRTDAGRPVADRVRRSATSFRLIPRPFLPARTRPRRRSKRFAPKWGLDQPLWLQFWRYIVAVAHGDLGTSLYTQRPIAEDLVTRVPATLELAIVSVVVATLIGIPLGVIAAVRRNSVRRSRVANFYRLRPCHRRVLAGHPLSIALRHEARLDAAQGPRQWLGARSCHRLLPHRCCDPAGLGGSE